MTEIFFQRTAREVLQINTGIFPHDGEGLYLALDYGVYPDITLGFQVDYSGGSDTREFLDYEIATTIIEKMYSTTIGISANGNYHFNTISNIPNRWGVYAGLSLAYEMGSTKRYYQNMPDDFKIKYKTNPHKYKPFPVCQIGGRFFPQII